MTTFRLFDKYPKKLGFGPTAKKIFAEANKHEEVTLDFENIEFMSMTFAQEYVYQKKNTSKTKIIEINMAESIEKLLQLVDREYEEFINS